MYKEYTTNDMSKFCPNCGDKTQERLFTVDYNRETGERIETWQQFCPKKVRWFYIFTVFCWEADTIYSGD